jgi:DNA helicase-2/ATP-dependent DNA helicase PcrA
MEAFRTDSGKLALHELTLRLIEDSGYMMMLQDEATEEAYERVENLFEFVSAIKDFEAANPGAALTDFLDHVALISDIDTYEDAPNRLTLMTIHSAKGLEFNLVFITGMEEGLFPHSRSTDDTDELEEERRLCYVGMTRAKKRLYMFSARMRSVWGETRYRLRSRFVDEIAPEFLEVVGEIASPEPVSNLSASNEVYYTTEESQIDGYDFDVAGDIGGDAGGALRWRIGMRVMHPSFGVGVIKDRSGIGEETKLTVRFQGTGTKKLMVKYAGLVPAP